MTINIPLQNNYEATLTQTLEGSATALTMYLDTVPVCTIPPGQYLRITINPRKGFDYEEDVLVESIDTSANTMTIKSGGRAQNRYAGDSPSALQHKVGSKVILSNPYGLWSDVSSSIDGKVDKTGDTMSGALAFSGTTHAGIQPVSLTTSERTALSLTSSDTAIVYDNTAGEYYAWQGGAWSALASGSTQPNASETTAGKVELATLAEQGAHTETGGSGAKLVLQSKNTIKTGSTNRADDENKVPVLGADGYINEFIDNSNLAASKTQITLTAGEAIDASTTPQAVYISDGSNGLTAGSVYLADADDLTNMAVRSVGVVAGGQNVNASDSVIVTLGGIVDGYSGLTPGVDYYLSTTAGAISTTVYNAGVPIGRAISATQLFVKPLQPSIWVNYSYTDSEGASGTTDTVMSIGFRARSIFCVGVFAEMGNSVLENTASSGQAHGLTQGSMNINAANDTVASNAYIAVSNHSLSSSQYSQVSVYAIDDDTITIRRVTSQYTSSGNNYNSGTLYFLILG